MTKILYIGNYKFAHCTEVHIARDFENLGHEVIRLQEDPEWHLLDMPPDDLADAIADERPDLVLWTRTWGLPPSTTELWRWCEDHGIVTASFHLDLYFGLTRPDELNPGSGDPFWTTQHVFSPDGNEWSEAKFKSLGINHHWSPPAIVSDECVPGTFREEWAHDVVFVGSRNYHKEWPWRRQLIDGLRRRYGDRFHHYGHSWESTIRTGLHEGIEEDGLWLNDLYASAKVVVGDSLNLPGNVNYISDRYFEVMGRGGFLLAPYVPVLDDLGFIEGLHLYTYSEHERTVPDLIARVDNMLDVSEIPAIERGVRQDAQAFVRENHTYKNRLAVALETMGLS